MEYSTYNVTTPEDSGLGESSRNESGPAFTPTTSLVASRKRKLPPNGLKHLQSGCSLESSPWIRSSEILSSTMNDSITTAVENCKLLDADSSFPQSREPQTPEKRPNKCRNIITTTSTRLSPLLKLGSPERNEILYCNLPKRCSPAKKRLFGTSFKRKDPVAVFCREKYYPHIMTKIFLSLSDEDLYRCTRVSRGWKREIVTHKALKLRVDEFVQNRIRNKENNVESPVFDVSFREAARQSTPMQTSKIFEMTNSLTEGQHLEMCCCCNRPEAIVEKNISQCTNYRCGAIRCLKCNSISTTGPENFVDKCQGSYLVYEKPQSRYSLLNSPKRFQNGIPTLFLDDSSQNASRTLNSSGYLTDADVSQTHHRHSASFTKEKTGFSHVLKTSNIDRGNKPIRNWERRNSVLPVITLTKRREEIVEPSSPPKVKHVAGTSKSKKMLKRLKL